MSPSTSVSSLLRFLMPQNQVLQDLNIYVTGIRIIGTAQLTHRYSSLFDPSQSANPAVMNCNPGPFPGFGGGQVYNIIAPSNVAVSGTATTTSTTTAPPAPTVISQFSEVWYGEIFYTVPPMTVTTIANSSFNAYFEQCAEICVGRLLPSRTNHVATPNCVSFYLIYDASAGYSTLPPGPRYNCETYSPLMVMR